MKNIAFLFILLLNLLLSSCENVVDLNLKTTPPRLVVEATLNWNKGTLGKQQLITLTTTSGYYDQSIPTVSGATVFIVTNTNVRFDFNEIPNTGKYSCSTFVPVINQMYTLTVLHKGETYNATETLKSVPAITRIEQNNKGGVLEKEIEIKTYYTDPASENNYYLFVYKDLNKIISDFSVSNDTFYQGNEIFSLYRNKDLKSGGELEINQIGISKEYYEYLSILISMAGGSSGAPFQSPSATVRGNLINKTNFDNYALGYFSLSETDSRKYTIK